MTSTLPQTSNEGPDGERIKIFSCRLRDEKPEPNFPWHIMHYEGHIPPYILITVEQSGVIE